MKRSVRIARGVLPILPLFLVLLFALALTSTFS